MLAVLLMQRTALSPRSALLKPACSPLDGAALASLDSMGHLGQAQLLQSAQQEPRPQQPQAAQHAAAAHAMRAQNCCCSFSGLQRQDSNSYAG